MGIARVGGEVDGEVLQVVTETEGVEGGEGGGVGGVAYHSGDHDSCHLAFVAVVPGTEADDKGVERHCGPWRDNHSVGIGT